MSKMLEQVANDIRHGDVRTIVAVGAGVVALLYVATRKKSYNLPPGPWPLPILGNLTSFMGKNAKALDVFKKLTDKYGPVFTLKLGCWNMVVLNKLEVVREALVQKQDAFAGRPQMATSDLFFVPTGGIPDISMGNPGPLWKFHRKIGVAAMRKYAGDQSLEKLIHHCCNEFISKVKEDAKNGPVDVKNLCYLLALNIVMGMCFGKHYSTDDPTFIKMQRISKDQIEIIGNGLTEDYFPIAKYFPSKQRRELLKIAEEYYALMFEGFEESKKNYNQDKENIKDLAGYLLQAREEAIAKDKSYEHMLSDTHLALVIYDVFGAGIDTVNYTLHWFIGLLTQHLDIQEKMQDEIDRVIGKGNLPTLENKSELQYLEAVLYESMRARSIAPTAVPHSTVCDTTLGGYDIPKDTIVLINIKAIHNDPDLWEEPNAFKPERFIGENGKTFRPDGFIPFSMGRRVCMGEAIAKNELMLVLSMLFGSLKFTPPKGEEFILEEEDIDLAQIAKPYRVDVEFRV